MADRECDEHAVPGMLRDKSDWSENGECKVKHQLQSEYWTIIYYSLLISICSFLISDIWKDRSSALRSGRCTRGAGLRQLQGMGPTRFVLAVDDDNEFRSRCE